MPFQAWILLGLLFQVIDCELLQWGHALSGMDTSVVEFHHLSFLELQWGHALSGMDTMFHAEIVDP